MPARRVRSARRRWGPGSSRARSCAVRLFVLMIVPGFGLNLVLVSVLLSAEAGELGKSHCSLGHARPLHQKVHHLVFERRGLDLPHRVLVLQVGASRLLGIRIACREILQSRMHALTV